MGAQICSGMAALAVPETAAEDFSAADAANGANTSGIITCVKTKCKAYTFSPPEKHGPTKRHRTPANHVCWRFNND